MDLHLPETGQNTLRQGLSRMRQRNIQNGIPTNDDSTKIFGSKIYLFRIYVYVCGLKTKSNSNMTLQQMEYIVAVYRLRHFAKAAEYCKVTQPTLSSMIQKLEDELGIKIFDRTAQPVTPTDIGQRVIEQSWKVLIRARKIKDIVAEAKLALGAT